jgi:hypothetical protein
MVAPYAYFPPVPAPHGIKENTPGSGVYAIDGSSPTADACVASGAAMNGGSNTASYLYSSLVSAVWILIFPTPEGLSLHSHWGIRQIDLTVRHSVHPANGSLLSSQVFKDTTLKTAENPGLGTGYSISSTVSNSIEDVEIITGTIPAPFTVLGGYVNGYPLGSYTTDMTYKAMQRILASSYSVHSSQTLDRDGSVASTVTITTETDDIVPTGHGAVFIAIKPSDPLVYTANPLAGSYPGAPPHGHDTWENAWGSRIGCAVVTDAIAKDAGGATIYTLVPSIAS